MADLVFPGRAPSSTLNSTAMPTPVDMQIYKGDFVEIYVTLRDEADVPLNLTNLTARASLRENYSSLAGINFVCTATGEPGEFRIYLSSPVTSQLASLTYIWDFEIVNAGGDSRTYLTGDVTVFPEVSRG